MIDGTLDDGDMFVICSDGLTTHVEDHEILALAKNYPAQRACDFLVNLTLDRGATDNVTVVIVRFRNLRPGRTSTATWRTGLGRGCRTCIPPMPSTIRLAQGTRLNGIYEIDQHIASGGMGEIYQRSRHRDRRQRRHQGHALRSCRQHVGTCASFAKRPPRSIYLSRRDRPLLCVFARPRYRQALPRDGIRRGSTALRPLEVEPAGLRSPR